MGPHPTGYEAKLLVIYQTLRHPSLLVCQNSTYLRRLLSPNYGHFPSCPKRAPKALWPDQTLIFTRHKGPFDSCLNHTTHHYKVENPLLLHRYCKVISLSSTAAAVARNSPHYHNNSAKPPPPFSPPYPSLLNPPFSSSFFANFVVTLYTPPPSSTFSLPTPTPSFHPPVLHSAPTESFSPILL